MTIFGKTSEKFRIPPMKFYRYLHFWPACNKSNVEIDFERNSPPSRQRMHGSAAMAAPPAGGGVPCREGAHGPPKAHRRQLAGRGAAASRVFWGVLGSAAWCVGRRFVYPSLRTSGSEGALPAFF